MSLKVEHISFSLSSGKIKALNKYRKEWPEELDFEFKIVPLPTGITVMVRPKEYGVVDWVRVRELGCW